jgi:putative transposase
VLADLKLVWGASSLREAEMWFEEFRIKWGSRYPQIINLWDVNRNELTTCFKYPREIRRLIYTVNTAEGFHRMLRKFTKVVYSDDDAVIKSVYLSVREIARKWDEPLKDWKTIIGQITKLFEDRLAA